MNIRELAKAICREIVVDVAVDDKCIATGLYYPDGDSVNIHLVGSTITDEGLTVQKLYDRGIRLAKGHKALLQNIQNRFGVEMRDSVLVKRVDDDCIGRDCLDFCEAVSYLSALAYQRQEPRSLGLRDDFDKFMVSAVRPRRSFVKEWFAEQYDPKGLFPVDYRMNGSGKARHIFVVSTTGKADSVAAVNGFLALKGISTPSMSVIDPDSAIGAKKTHRLELVSDAVCFGVRGNEERIIKFATDEA